MKKCDLCGERAATLVDTTTLNSGTAEYAFCEECYKTILKSGLSPFDVMQKKEARKGKVCEKCGATAEEFAKTFMFGCPDCYRDMRAAARGGAVKAQGTSVHIGKRPAGKRL